MHVATPYPKPPATVPTWAEHWLAQGHAKLAEEDFIGAVTAYRRAVQMQPESDLAHAYLALALQLQGVPRRAKLAAQAALNLQSKNSLALKVLARVQLDWGNPDLAREHCDAALALDPADADALIIREQCRTEEIILPNPPPGGGPGYDAYVSLGNNCEVGLQFRRIGYEESSFFRFTSNSLESVLAIIRNDFAGVFQRENLQPHTDDMVMDTRYDIVFHSGLKSVENPGSAQRHFLPSYDFDEVYGCKDAPKVRHLVAKWHALTRSQQEVLYILKLNDENRRALATDLLALFREKYPAHRATILCLQTVDPAESDWEVPGLINRHFPRFAPFDNTHDADTAAWDRIFAEFPLRPTPDSSLL